MAAALMQRYGLDACIVGADRVVANGAGPWAWGDGGGYFGMEGEKKGYGSYGTYGYNFHHLGYGPMQLWFDIHSEKWKKDGLAA